MAAEKDKSGAKSMQPKEVLHMVSESGPQEMASQTKNVIIIGGGLAGMTVAKEVLKKGLSVTILESSERLGGKAGSDPDNDGLLEDHGYHVFPGWYLNTRKLLEELGASKNLIDLDRTHFLIKPAASEAESSNTDDRTFLTIYQLSGIRSAFKNLLTTMRMIPKLDAILAVYSAIDLLSESWNRRRFLDRTSANGFLRGRAYVTDWVAEYQQQTVLQASSIPSYEVSAMTIKNVIDRWTHSPSPLLSFFDGNLQDTFIEPFHRRILELGDQNGGEATIITGWTVDHIAGSKERITGIVRDTGEVLDVANGDMVVLATPVEVARNITDAGVYEAEAEAAESSDEIPALGNLWHLETEPMAALTMYFTDKIPNIPKEHVNLSGSPLKTSFIDISQHWSSLADQSGTVLDVIASDFVDLQALPQSKMAELIMKDVLDWLRVDRSAVRTFSLHSNVDKQLFINTVGCWPYRPRTKTLIPNLYITGDYCQSMADLTTMESAIESGLNTAARLLGDLGHSVDVGYVPLVSLPRSKIWILKLLMWIPTYGIFLFRTGWNALTWPWRAAKSLISKL